MVNRSMPPGVIIPELPYEDVNAAAAWLCQVFGFKPSLRIGDHRFQLSFGQSSVFYFSPLSFYWPLITEY